MTHQEVFILQTPASLKRTRAAAQEKIMGRQLRHERLIEAPAFVLRFMSFGATYTTLNNTNKSAGLLQHLWIRKYLNTSIISACPPFLPTFLTAQFNEDELPYFSLT